jgi:hypothetical protein
MAKRKRIFVAFAIEDKRYRDLLRGQSKLGHCPIDYTDMSVKQPWDSAWKTKCRQRVKGCDGVIALLSRNMRAAAGARWEIKCAVDEGVPVLGVYVSRTDVYSLRRLSVGASYFGAGSASATGSTNAKRRRPSYAKV